MKVTDNLTPSLTDEAFFHTGVNMKKVIYVKKITAGTLAELLLYGYTVIFVGE